MSADRVENEPSMEEILASIRRIISEDEEAGDDAARPSNTDAGTDADVEVEEEWAVDSTAEPAEAPLGPRNGNPYAQAGDLGPAANDVLELTEMIAEDGSVVTIDAGRQTQADGAPPQTGDAFHGDETYGEEPYVEAQYDDPHYADEAAEEVDPSILEESPLSSEQVGEAPGQPSRYSRDYGRAMAPEKGYYVDEPEPAPGGAAFDDSATSPPREAATPHGGPRILQDEGAYEASTARGAAAEEETMDDGNEKRSGARMGKTGGSAFAELAGGDYVDERDDTRYTAPDNDSEFSGETESALEDLIRQAVQPMLREWLEETLPDLVERIVRQEIKKLIERRGGL